MVSMNNTILQSPSGATKKPKSPLSRVPKCPLCEHFMLDGQPTDFRQIRLTVGKTSYTTCRRVHTSCEVRNG